MACSASRNPPVHVWRSTEKRRPVAKRALFRGGGERPGQGALDPERPTPGAAEAHEPALPGRLGVGAFSAKS
jgi:hypothetical protein